MEVLPISLRSSFKCYHQSKKGEDIEATVPKMPMVAMFVWLNKDHAVHLDINF